MFTLKLRWVISEQDERPDSNLWSDVEDHTVFLEVSDVTVHGVADETALAAWGPGDFIDYRWIRRHSDGGNSTTPGRLLCCTLANGQFQCYAVGQAWLMSSSGQTIERLAP
jgi:hypothetical protein